MTSDFPSRQTRGVHAVVLGASLAGLLAARVLSQYFERVTVVDRDLLVDDVQPRKRVPQGYHTHVLLDRGRLIFQKLFPGLMNDLRNAGGVVIDPGLDFTVYSVGDYSQNLETGLEFLCVTRPFLERHIRARVGSIENVTLRAELRFEDLNTTEGGTRISGVQLAGRGGSETLEADLVVDSMGRNSPIPKWLAESGFGAPEEDVVKIWFAYSSRLWRREQTSTPIRGYFIQSTPPEAHIGFMFPTEGDRWITSLGGWGNDNHPPTDDTGYLEFAKALPAPDIYELISQSEPVTSIRPYKFPSSLRRRYEKMNSVPDGLITLGDSYASFNPIYGQGMSSAAMQAEILDSELQADDSRHLTRRFYKRAAKVVDIPWTLAVGADFRYETTEGKKPLGTDLINRYLLRLNRAGKVDVDLNRAFADVINLTKPAASLFHPKWVWRVIRKGSPRQSDPTTAIDRSMSS